LVIQKLILMIFRVCLGRIQKVTWNLEYLVDVTCRCTCRKCDFKLYKIQTKSENHETCRCVVLSHVEMSGFLASDVTICSKPLQFFTTASTCDNTTHRQVSWFSDFVCILYNLKSHFRQVPRHVTSTRYSRFHVTFWIRPKHTLNIMSINFWMTKVHYSMYLQFKFEISQTIRWNEIN